MKSNGRQRGLLLALLVFAAVARLLYLFAYRSDPFSSHLLHDASVYHHWASALASGHNGESGAFYQAPLYPYLVAALYRIAAPDPLAVYVFQLVLGIVTIFLVFRSACRAYGEAAGLAAATITTLYAPLVFFETKLLSASVAVFLSALLIERMQAADSTRREVEWLIPGAVLGLAALTQPGLLVTGLLGTVWISLDRSRPPRQRVLRVLYLVVGAGLVILPVTIRNYRVSGEWVVIASNGGVTCYQGNNPNAVGVFSTPPGFSGKITEQRAESRRLAEEEAGTSMGDGAVSSFYFHKALAFLSDDLLHATGLLTGKFLLAAANDEQPLEYNQRLDVNPFRRLFPVPFAVVLALAAVRVFSRRKERPEIRAEAPFLLLVLTEGVVLLVFYVSGRYRLPMMPGLAPIAGFGVVSLWRGFAAKSHRTWAMAATAAIVGAISFAYVPLARGDLREQQLAMSYIDRATALLDVGRHDEAIEAMRRSLTLDPVFAERHLSLAQMLYQAGRIDEAESAAREAMRRDPNSMEALFLYGVLCIEQRRLEEAASVFTKVLRREPTRENAANNLLGVLIHLGRMDEAISLRRQLGDQGVSVDPSLDEQMRARETEANIIAP